ncbi:hypothetical protein AVEN_36005-1, partial [Araneus ventricosus]
WVYLNGLHAWVTLPEKTPDASPIPPRVTTPATMRQHNRLGVGALCFLLLLFLIPIVLSSTRPSPRVRQRRTIHGKGGECSFPVGRRPWTPEEEV